MRKTKIVIYGKEGRMGRSLAACAMSDSDLLLVSEVGRGDSIAKSIQDADVIVDFTNREATKEILESAAYHSKALVLGTTGHTESEKEEIRRFSKKIPIVYSSNFSTGVNVLFYLTEHAAHLLDGFDVEITEVHHKTKKDSPSGTAKRLQEVLAAAGKSNMPTHSLRIGDVVGEHTVTFASSGEQLAISHRATSRDTFARGALCAAKWIVGKDAGLYDMQDVLGLRT